MRISNNLARMDQTKTIRNEHERKRAGQAQVLTNEQMVQWLVIALITSSALYVLHAKFTEDAGLQEKKLQHEKWDTEKKLQQEKLETERKQAELDRVKSEQKKAEAQLAIEKEKTSRHLINAQKEVNMYAMKPQLVQERCYEGGIFLPEMCEKTYRAPFQEPGVNKLQITAGTNDEDEEYNTDNL